MNAPRNLATILAADVAGRLGSERQICFTNPQSLANFVMYIPAMVGPGGLEPPTRPL